MRNAVDSDIFASTIVPRVDAGAHVCAIAAVPTLMVEIVMKTLDAREHSPLNQSAIQAALGLPGDDFEAEPCDVFVLSMDRVDVNDRQSLLMGLPSLLRHTKSPRNAIVMTGPNCSSPGYMPQRYITGGACMRYIDPSTPTPAGVIRRGNRERFPCDAVEACWLERWRELHEDRAQLRDSRCYDSRADSENGGHQQVTCIGTVSTAPSICDQQQALLGGILGEPISWRPKDPAWRPNPKWKRSVLRRLYHSLRYLTALPCKAHVCLAFKNDLFETYVAAIRSEDGLRFDSAPILIMPKEWPARTMLRGRRRRIVEYARSTHNLAIAPANGSYLFAGGRYRPSAAEAEVGVWTATRSSLVYSEAAYLFPGTNLHINPNGLQGATLERVHDNKSQADAASSQSPYLAIRGEHPGCVEQREPESLSRIGVPQGACEFDGRFSLAQFKGRKWLFGRANLAAKGQRFVQVASSVDLVNWSPFQLIRIHGYKPPHGDIYFFAAQPNPVDSQTMLAVFPLVHRARACICLSVSLDAVHWSAPRPLLHCHAAGERSVHQPAVGLLRRGDQVLLYIHENVPGIREDAKTPEKFRLRLRQVRRKIEPRIVRYIIAADTLRSWSDNAVRSIEKWRQHHPPLS